MELWIRNTTGYKSLKETIHRNTKCRGNQLTYSSCKKCYIKAINVNYLCYTTQNYSVCSLMPTAHMSATDQWKANCCTLFFITLQGLGFLSTKSFIWRTFQGLLLHTIFLVQDIFAGLKVKAPWKTLNCSKELLSTVKVSGVQRNKFIIQWSSKPIPNYPPWFKILFKPKACRSW